MTHQNVFDDCLLDGYQCSDYHGQEAGCPLMPIGDPVGNSPLEVMNEYTAGR